ncbi:hypothetical protein M0Q97_08945 [Candidatus Dojkabacteria bacterium]|jgi:hypothetical protein|nr:hypothetical protein [Candidatus Dojkabacteria bacterium]
MSIFSKKIKELSEEYKESLRKQEEYNSSTIFTEEEKQICDIIIKSDFSKCNVMINRDYFGYDDYHISKFIYNNLKLHYKHYSHAIDNYFNLYRLDNGHFLKTIKMGKAKIEIINNIIKDKFQAYVENSITSAFNNKNENAGDCPYCGTKNAENKTNCINCGAVLTFNK